MTDPQDLGRALRLPPAVFRARRERVLDQIGSGVLLVGSAPELFRPRGAEVPYRQSADLYYLTGLEEPGSLALLTPHDPDHRFTLFVRPRDRERETWNGPRIGVERAKALFGADAVYPIDELDERATLLIRGADRVYHSIGADAESDRRLLELVSRARRGGARTGSGPVGIVDVDTVVGEMRKVKDAHELERMRTAAGIAVAGHLAVMHAARPGIGEWELEAVLESTFRSRGAVGPAFSSIVGSGPNATVLHYTANDRRARPGDLILVDAGAEWGMYCSDITRTFPVSGRFTRAQRALYDVVLGAEVAGIDAVRPGAPISAVHDAAIRALAEGMLELGILHAGSATELIETGGYRRFYMHQTSHWLGLDVHDVGVYREHGQSVALRPGMVLTVEPGIYIPEDADGVPGAYRGLGIRIEDSVVVTSGGREVLTRGVPVAPDEVEELVGSR